MTESMLWILGQTIVLAILIGGAFMRTRERITKLETTCEHIQANTESLKQDHRDLVDKVDGISRHVERLEGKLG